MSRGVFFPGLLFERFGWHLRVIAMTAEWKRFHAWEMAFFIGRDDPNICSQRHCRIELGAFQQLDG